TALAPAPATPPIYTLSLHDALPISRTARDGRPRTRAGRRQPRQGHRDRRLDRAHRLRAADRTARRGADRSAVRATGRIRPVGRAAGGGAPQMADRDLPALVSDQEPGGGPTLHPRAGPARHRENVTSGTDPAN